MRRYLICPDSFKSCASSLTIAKAIKNGIIKGLSLKLTNSTLSKKQELTSSSSKTNTTSLYSNNITLLPLADGGEGTLSIIKYILKNNNLDSNYIKSTNINNALGNNTLDNNINNTIHYPNKFPEWLYCKKLNTAFIELAQTSGLETILYLNNNKLTNDIGLNASTYGTGETLFLSIIP